MAMKTYLFSVFVLTSCLTFCYAGYDAKTQRERASLKELLAAVMAEDKSATKAASLSLQQQDDADEGTPLQQQEEDGDSVDVQQDDDNELL